MGDILLKLYSAFVVLAPISKLSDEKLVEHYEAMKEAGKTDKIKLHKADYIVDSKKGSIGYMLLQKLRGCKLVTFGEIEDYPGVLIDPGIRVMNKEQAMIIKDKVRRTTSNIRERVLQISKQPEKSHERLMDNETLSMIIQRIRMVSQLLIFNLGKTPRYKEVLDDKEANIIEAVLGLFRITSEGSDIVCFKAALAGMAKELWGP